MTSSEIATHTHAAMHARAYCGPMFPGSPICCASAFMRSFMAVTLRACASLYASFTSSDTRCGTEQAVFVRVRRALGAPLARAHARARCAHLGAQLHGRFRDVAAAGLLPSL